MKIENCAVCKKPATMTCIDAPADNPLGDTVFINCEADCQGGFSGRNPHNIAEEWNETQRVLLVNESAHSRDAG